MSTFCTRPTTQETIRGVHSPYTRFNNTTQDVIQSTKSVTTSGSTYTAAAATAALATELGQQLIANATPALSTKENINACSTSIIGLSYVRYVIDVIVGSLVGLYIYITYLKHTVGYSLQSPTELHTLAAGAPSTQTSL